MSGEGFKVEDDAVRRHARAIAGIGRRVQVTAEAGKATQALDGQAYGLIGRAFAEQAQAAVEGAVQGLTSTAATAQAMASGLEATAEFYRQAERTNAELLGGGR